MFAQNLFYLLANHRVCDRCPIMGFRHQVNNRPVNFLLPPDWKEDCGKINLK